MNNLKVAIVNYEGGNLYSMFNAIKSLVGEDSVKIISDSNDVDYDPTHIILPGVGSFNKSIEELKKKTEIYAFLQKNVLEQKKKFLGVCVGMQLLADCGYENIKSEGLGWIGGSVLGFSDILEDGYKVPHTGWNNISVIDKGSKLYDFSGLDFYFVHSYYFKVTQEKNILAESDYGVNFPAIIGDDNILACQFHPEKIW